MTIAAGFVCSDGVVLCADTLLSANYRQQGPKVWLWQGRDGQAVAVAGAGSYILLKLAKEAIFDRLNRLAKINAKLVKHSVVEPVINSIQTDHVDKATDWDRLHGYGVALLIAVRDKGKTVLYETDRRACSEVARFSCVGTGAPVGNYVSSIFFSPSLSVMWAQVAAAYVIQQTKAYGDDCGGDTNIVILRDAP